MYNCNARKLKSFFKEGTYSFTTHPIFGINIDDGKAVFSYNYNKCNRLESVTLDITGFVFVVPLQIKIIYYVNGNVHFDDFLGGSLEGKWKAKRCRMCTLFDGIVNNPDGEKVALRGKNLLVKNSNVKYTSYTYESKDGQCNLLATSEFIKLLQ